MTNLPPQQWIQTQDEAFIPRLLGRLLQLVCFAVIIVLYGISGSDELDALEIDFLASGHTLSEVISGAEGSWIDRLEKGFHLPEGHPDQQIFRDGERWRANYSDSPAMRWVSGLLHYVVGDGNTVMELATWLARLWILLATLLLANLARRLRAESNSEGLKTWNGLFAGMLFLALPGVLSATSAPGASAFAAFAMMLFMSEAVRYFRLEYEAWRLGLAWGLCVSVHPAGIFLLIPCLAVMLMGRNGSNDEPAPGATEPDAGAIALPSVSLGLFFVPVIGLFFCILIWPSLWIEPGRGLVAWFTETGWRLVTPQQVLGLDFDPSSGRAPHVWVALLQWLSRTPLILVLACCVGLVALRNSGRSGLWLACLILCTVLLLGGLNGGLFVGRHSLWPWCWGATALLATQGLVRVTEAIMNRWEGMGRKVSIAVLLILFVLLPLGSTLARSNAALLPQVGAAERMPIPYAELQQMAEITPGGRVHIASGFWGYRYAIGVLVESTDLGLSWAERKHADWIVVVDAGTDEIQQRISRPWGGEQPEWEEMIGGVWMRAYRKVGP